MSQTRRNILDRRQGKSGKKVFVGLSGGVDSAVSAYLLKKAGYSVTGIFIKTWQPFDEAQGKPIGNCTWKEDRRDAMRVAAHLEIPFITMDLEKEYKKHVVDYMIGEYKLGRTPNPDVMCNKEIKFGAFLQHALKLGADFIATGHYSRVAPRRITNYELRIKNNFQNLPDGKAGSKFKLSTINYQLQTGADPSKDQSYFLWTLKQEQLAKIIFPIGELNKSEVRKIAKKIGLPNAEKKDSQGICMLGDISIKEFLSHYIPQKKGKVLNSNGEEIGYHEGSVFLTIGERHGFTITKKSPDDKRMYVVAKDFKKNTIIVGTEKDLVKENEQVKKEVILEKTNWINDEPTRGKLYDAQIRYHQKLQKCSIFQSKNGSQTTVEFESPQTAASGQSVVIYEKDVCVGGGIING